jgi:hypothetical protein
MTGQAPLGLPPAALNTCTPAARVDWHTGAGKRRDLLGWAKCFLPTTAFFDSHLPWQDLSALCHIWFKNSASKYWNGYLLPNSACNFHHNEWHAQLRRHAAQLLVRPSIWVLVPFPPVLQSVSPYRPICKIQLHGEKPAMAATIRTFLRPKAIRSATTD